ncbi:ROK family protein [bacterium]|jgi:predicted NBD/HSP70 family sugar kinase|nr:ROK family protein [bacterium]MBT4250848.1 ROK family protein [bacterium]MBT4597560.1 ROK family protein [bacterium]MBT6754026.1 ROK family protein [bacterium]MBT7038056.1 ROK family protein [bacterium]
MYFVFDIGGTKIRVAVSTDKKTISDYKVFSTPGNFSEGVEMIVSAARGLSGGQKITAIAGGIGAPLNKNKTGVVTSYATINKSLSSWAGEPLRSALETELQATVFLENDTEVIGLAEAAQIDDYKNKIIAYYTISSGVGGSLIDHGEISSNTMGFEPGNQIIDPLQTLCPGCEKPGRLEDLIGGNYIEERTGKLPEEINDEAFWDDIARYLAIGLTNSAVHWSLDTFILGGSVMHKISIPLVEKYLQKYLTIYPQLPKIQGSQLGDLGGLQGSIAYLNSKLAQ